jgi:3-oxoacyl-[acyl-carrier protein] reductase
MFSSFENRAVIVTGATRGIGKGIARVFGRAGAQVLLVGRDEAAGQAAAADVQAEGAAKAVFFAADVATREGCEAMAAKAVEVMGGIDVLCANAGIFPEKRLEEMTEADLDWVLSTNVKSAFWSVQACTDALAKSGSGRVILTSSITGPITGFPGWTHYGASKAAQLGFMRTAALELAPKRITVNAVLPGNVMTEGLLGMGEDYVAGMAAAIPTGGVGTVEDIGYAALYLASKEAGFVTAQSIVVDGGQTIPESPDAILPMS